MNKSTKKKGLVIDDDASVRCSVRAVLGRAGFAVREAEGGRIGGDEIQRQTPDLVLCDIGLPGVGGSDIVASLRSRQGQEIPVSRQVLAHRGLDGQVKHLSIAARDVSETGKAERERNQMEIQLRHAQKMEAIGQLAAGIAHEIHTPTQYIGDNTRFLKEVFHDLMSLLGQCEELAEAARTDRVTPELIERLAATARIADVPYLAREIPRAIGQSLEGIERVSRIVRAMKDFSHPGQKEKTPVDLPQAIDSTLTISRNEWKYVAEVVVDFDSNLPPVPCLPDEFNQVILHLVINAAHAIADVVGAGEHSKGTITVRTRRLDGWAEIRIEDTGTGIPERIRNRVFDAFFTTKPVGKGTGQGLALAHSVIVDQHGGTIHFETEAGQGTAFIIRLPLNGGPK
jgi:signal transduction histidine kinase